MTINVALAVKPPTAGYVKREGQYLTRDEIEDLAEACTGEYADVVRVLALAGLRWGELAGLKVGDRVRVPGEGLRLQRSVMSSRDRGVLFVDTLKSKRSRTFPLVDDLVPVVDKWSDGKSAGVWLFPAPNSGPLSEPNWNRSVGWAAAIRKITDRRSGCTTCGIRARLCGWGPALIPRSCSGSSDMLRRR